MELMIFGWGEGDTFKDKGQNKKFSIEVVQAKMFFKARKVWRGIVNCFGVHMI